MSRHFFRFLAIAALVLGASACTAVTSQVSTFHTLPAQVGGKTVAILLAIEPSRQGVESHTYQDKLSERFWAAGYRVVTGNEKTPPDYVAVFAYGIDNGTLVTSNYSTPTYGITGYTGPNNMPTYGLTGVQSGSSTDRVFRRVVLLRMYDSTKFQLGKPETLPGAMVYEGKVQSDGSCGSFAAVMDPFLKVRTVIDPQLNLGC